jgi:hypothetical protein
MSFMPTVPRASQADPLPCLEHAGLTEDHGVKDAEGLPDLGPAARSQRRGAVAVHLPGPARQGGDRRVTDVLPDLRGVLVQARWIEQVGH